MFLFCSTPPSDELFEPDRMEGADDEREAGREAQVSETVVML